MSRVKKLQDKLLDWYDNHQRVMPWRARNGKRPNPYHVWLSEIMLQQTTVVTVGPYFKKFIKKWPTVKKLSKAELDEVLTAWAGLGYYARARNLHKCAQVIVGDFGGRFPKTEEELMKLPGIGPYTAAAIVSIAFDKPAVAVDGNVERVVSRFFAIENPLPQSKKELYMAAEKLARDLERPGDFTQGLMELGATICMPRNPKCGICPWATSCKAKKIGIAESLPRKQKKRPKPRCYGKVFFIQNKKGQFLVHKRLGKGLYAGMYQLPTTDWLEDKKQALRQRPDFCKGLRLLSRNETVEHSFTHFDLMLEIYYATVSRKPVLKESFWVAPEDVQHYALPTLMHKVIRQGKQS